MGFEVNPYNPCVANKIVNRTQMTVCWLAHDLKISHKDPMEATKFIMEMGQIYGSEMSVTRDKAHKYLGMDLDYTGHIFVKISMIKYVDKFIRDFPEKVTTKSANPASDHLFDISEDNPGKLLPEGQAQDFHHSVMQMYACDAQFEDRNFLLDNSYESTRRA